MSHLHLKHVRKHVCFSLILLGLCVLLTACNTPRHKRFVDVKPGMEKDLVIDQAGGPNVSRRLQGKDRWIYNFPEAPNGPQTKEVHFENGRAVYVGEKYRPKVSAEEQDRLNDESNQKEAVRDASEIARWNEEHGVANQLKTGDQLDRQDLRIQRSMYGTSPQRERNQIAPRFESIE